MKYIVEIACNNAAFEDSGGSGIETARILRELADKLEAWTVCSEVILADFNGQTVGRAYPKHED